MQSAATRKRTPRCAGALVLPVLLAGFVLLAACGSSRGPSAVGKSSSSQPADGYPSPRGSDGGAAPPEPAAALPPAAARADGQAHHRDEPKPARLPKDSQALPTAAKKAKKAKKAWRAKETAADDRSAAVETEAPRLFPWPPPSPTTRVEMDISGAPPGGDARTLGDINRHLVTALDGAGYGEKGWYSVPGGFALVTRIEQIREDGSPRSGNARWSTAPRFGAFSMGEYLRALLTATPGLFRVIAFVVTDQDFDEAPQPMTEELAADWGHSGAPRLPTALAGRPASKNTYCVALIYEFAKHRYDVSAHFVTSSNVPAADQLRRSGLAAMVGAL